MVERGTQLRVREGAAPAVRVTAGRNAHDEHGLAFSPDSARIAFFSDADARGGSSFFIAPLKGKAPRATCEALKG